VHGLVHARDTSFRPDRRGFEFFVGNLVFEKRLCHSEADRPAPIKAICVQRSVIASDLPLPTHTTVLANVTESEEGAKSRAATIRTIRF